MNGKLFTAHNGKLYQNEATSVQNNLVGQGVFKSKVKFVCNQQMGYRDWETDRKSTRLNSSHSAKSRMPSSA